MSLLRLGLPEEGLCLPSNWGSLRRGCVSPQTGAPLRLGLPEDRLCLPSDQGSPALDLSLKQFSIPSSRPSPHPQGCHLCQWGDQCWGSAWGSG